MAKELVSLDEFVDWHGEARGVEIESHFGIPPYVPAEAIHVDVSRLARIAKLGRISALQIGSYSENVGVSYTANSINSDGSASVGAIKQKTAARSHTSISRQQDNSRDFPRGEYSIRVNMNHPDMDDKVLRKPEPWASLLDKGMREGIKDASKTQLTEPHRTRLARFTSYNAFDLAMFGSVSALFGDPSLIAYWFGYRMLDDSTGFSLELYNKIRKRNNQDIEKSLFMHYPIDRLLGVKALTATTKLVTTKIN